MAEATTPKSSAIVSVGAIFAALSGFSILIITARTLTAEDNAIFLAFWSTLFLITGILSGIQQEVTRAVANESLISRKEESVRPLILGISIGVLASLAFLAVSPLLSCFRNRLSGRIHLTFNRVWAYTLRWPSQLVGSSWRK